jgi:hypothetical protein
MAGPDPIKSGLEKWQDGLSSAISDPAWDAYDCEIQLAVGDFNRHLNGVATYQLLDWQLIKAMLWVESGAAHPEWKLKPMQIGVAGDPGLSAFLSSDEGGELILPSAWKGQLTMGSVRTIPAHNIRAGIGYLLMRMANFEFRSVLDADTKVYEVTVKAGDSLDKIARQQGSTVEAMTALNPGAAVIRPGQVLKYQKASVKRVITSWRFITTTLIAQRYNGGGDPNYAKKLDFALALVRKGKMAVCP